MKKTISILLVLIFTLLISLTGCAGKNDNTTESKLNKCVKNYAENKKFNGTVLIAKDNKILLNSGYGNADIYNNVKNSPQTVFEIGQITYQFTVASILMLQEKNLLNVQDTVSKYIPDYPQGDRIKLFNLLTNSSGISEYLSSCDSKQNYTPEQIIELFKNKELRFAPGSQFGQSNSNFALLGYIIEKASGMKYEDYVETNILKPLKLNNTGFLTSKEPVKNKAKGYAVVNGKTSSYEANPTNGTYMYSAGEIYSTTDDLYKWENALFDGKVIKNESLKEMLTPYKDSFSYGLCVNKRGDGSTSYYTPGSTSGFASFISMNTRKKTMIIILSNSNENVNILDNMVKDISEILG